MLPLGPTPYPGPKLSRDAMDVFEERGASTGKPGTEGIRHPPRNTLPTLLSFGIPGVLLPSYICAFGGIPGNRNGGIGRASIGTLLASELL